MILTFPQRILCFELVAKENCNWSVIACKFLPSSPSHSTPLDRVLRYVKSAIGETDVPESLPEFIGQRRRWLNGSFFAATYSIAHTGQILRSGHSVGRKVALLIETFYNIINLVFSWFSVVSLSSTYVREGDSRECLQGNFYLFFVCPYRGSTRDANLVDS